MKGDVKGELPQSRLTPRQLPQGGSLWQCGKVLCFAKGPISEGAVERSETGGVFPAKAARNPIFQRTYVNKLRISKNRKIF